MKFASLILLSAAALASLGAWAQNSGSASPERQSSFDESGSTSINGRVVSYLIRRLPVNSFPDLPGPIVQVLNQRGCLIPQTYQAHRPENVIHGSFERAGSSDWAVLCSAQGRADLLVFFGQNPGKPITLESAAEVQRLQRHDTAGVFGFDWGIDAASPEQVREAEEAADHRGAKPDHDAVEDTVLNKQTVYHVYSNSAWKVVDTSD